MKERPLGFNIDDNPVPVALSEKDKKDAIKTAMDLAMAAGEVISRLKDNKLETGFSNTLLSLFESYTVDLHKIFNFSSVLKKEHEERIVEIRAVNQENRELRKQLGEKVSAEDVREKLKNLRDVICQWWNKEGFGFVHEITFHPYVCMVKLSGTMSIHFQEHPEKNHPEYLKSKGYETAEPERGNIELVSNDKNIKLLTTEILKRFPSAEIHKIMINNWRKSPHIDYVEFNIKDFSDI
jgi:regulator of replication initiation timing